MFFDNLIEKLIEVIFSGNLFKANKGIRWMPRHLEAMKDVVSCDKLRGVAHTL